MEKSNKQTILKEIDAWRKSRLLPTEYCDFLSNLYTEGESVKLQADRSRWKPSSIEWKQLLLALISAAVVFLLVLHFTSFPNWMQIGLLIISTIIFYVIAFRVPLPISYLRVVFLTAACMLVAADGYFLLRNFGLQESTNVSLFVFVMILVVWILTGAVGESRMIVSAAWIGIAILYEFALLYMRGIHLADYGWNSVYWLIFAVVSMALGIFMGRSSLLIAPVWAASAIFVLLIPDFLYLFSGDKPSFLIDITAFLKISLLVTFVIVFREGIQNWLDRFKITQYNKR